MGMGVVGRGFIALLLMLGLEARADVDGDDGCPLIRPTGLVPEQVDAVVVGKVAQLLGRDPRGIDTKVPFKALDRTDNAILTYSFAALGIGEALGFDAIERYGRAVAARSSAHPFEEISVGEMQALAREVYFAGKDSDPPAVKGEEEFKLHRILVRAPSPPQGWSLIACGSEEITFRRVNDDETMAATASARVIGMPRYRGERAFLKEAKKAASLSVPKDTAAPEIEAVMVPDTSVPCADIRHSGGTGYQRYAVFGRFCYTSQDSKLGYAALYSQLGDRPPERVEAEARSFIEGASPK